MDRNKRKPIASLFAVIFAIVIKELPQFEGVGNLEYTIVFMLAFLCMNELLKE